MKTPFRILILALTFSAFAVSAYAGPGPQHWESQRLAAQFKKLKPGDKLNFVCMHCKTITEVPIESKDQAMSLCMQGSMVSSPDCNMKMKVVNNPGGSGDPFAAASEVIYVDDKGEECGFFVKANGRKYHWAVAELGRLFMVFEPAPPQQPFRPPSRQNYGR